MKRVGILISGSGSNMVKLVESMAVPDHPAEPVLVLSNRVDALGLDKAQALGVPTAVIDHRGRSREDFEADVTTALEAARVDIVCLAGFMRVLSASFVDHWAGRVLNIHPSILPLFKGLHTHQRALDEGMAVHGCTAHVVTAELDAGPILGQAVIAIRPGDTAESLAARLLPVEHRLYPAVLRAFASGAPGKVAILG